MFAVKGSVHSTPPEVEFWLEEEQYNDQDVISLKARRTDFDGAEWTLLYFATDEYPSKLVIADGVEIEDFAAILPMIENPVDAGYGSVRVFYRDTEMC